MRRRAFTLLEVLLAAVLGAMVVITCVAMFGALNRVGTSSRHRAERAVELTRTHRILGRTFRLLLMSDTPYPRPDAPGAVSGVTGATAPPGAPQANEGSAGSPRLILALDPSLPDMEYEVYQDGVPVMTLITPQRLEVALARPPVFLEPVPGYIPVGTNFDIWEDPARESRGIRRDRPRWEAEREAQPTEGAEATTPEDASEPLPAGIAPGLRGVFEVTWEPVTDPRDVPQATLDAGGSWTLWWRPMESQELFAIASESAELGEEGEDRGRDREAGAAEAGDASRDRERDRARGPFTSELDETTGPPQRLALATNLRTVRWEVVRDSETLEELAATWADELPAYITLEIVTTNGRWQKWMFEVNMNLCFYGPEPGSAVEGQPGNASELPIQPVAGADANRAGEGSASRRRIEPTRPGRGEDSAMPMAPISPSRPRAPARPATGGSGSR